MARREEFKRPRVGLNIQNQRRKEATAGMMLGR